MELSRFTSSTFGDLVTDEDLRYAWFRPKRMPRALSLDDETLLALSRADEALGRLAGVGQLLTEPRILMGAYSYKEALASARIEGTQADLDEVFVADRRGDGRRHEVTMVSNYRQALTEGLDLVRESGQLTFEIVGRVHARLMGESSTTATSPRVQPVWLGSPTDRPQTATYVPPIGSALGEALDDWEKYLAEEIAAPPLIRAALIHYQFLTVHPFRDGNGRAGRLLVLLYLFSVGRLPVPLLYLSPYFESRRREYYDRLQAVRERGEIQEWCQFFLTAVWAQANDGVTRAGRLLSLRESYRKQLAGSRNRSGEVVEMMFENPILTTSAVKDALKVSSQGALNLIRSLESRGWLARIGNVGRGGSTLWIANQVYDAMASEDQGEPDGE